MKDEIKIEDFLELNSHYPGGATLKQLWKQGKEPIEIKGFFSLVCRERGKLVPGTRREGFNICTLTGREYVAQMISYQSDGIGGKEAIRNDRMLYFGFGRGQSPEVSSVSQLADPVIWDDLGRFLAEVSFPTFPLSPARTTARYARTYTELQLSVSGTVPLTEAGFFTDGRPQDNYQSFRVDPDDLLLVPAGTQPPMFYKAFEVMKKTQNFVLEAAWEIRL